MEFRYFTYYRSGVALAKFRISEEKAYCTPRDVKTMEFGAEREFSLPMDPFSPELDRRLEEAVLGVQKGFVPEDYEKAEAFTAEINEKERAAERYVQPRGWYPLDFIVGHVSMNKITGGFRCGGFGGGGGF